MLPDIQPSRLTLLNFNMAGYPKITIFDIFWGIYLKFPRGIAYIAHLSFSYALQLFFSARQNVPPKKSPFGETKQVVGASHKNIMFNL